MSKILQNINLRVSYSGTNRKSKLAGLSFTVSQETTGSMLSVLAKRTEEGHCKVGTEVTALRNEAEHHGARTPAYHVSLQLPSPDAKGPRRQSHLSFTEKPEEKK